MKNVPNKPNGRNTDKKEYEENIVKEQRERKKIATK